MRKVGESGRKYAFDFKRFPELIGGDTLASVVSVTSSAGQTLGSPVISGSQVVVPVFGATPGTYTMTCNVTTAAGIPLESTFQMVVAP